MQGVKQARKESHNTEDRNGLGAGGRAGHLSKAQRKWDNQAETNWRGTVKQEKIEGTG